MSGELHEALVASLEHGGARTDGFRAALAEHVSDWVIGDWRRVPDAYVIDPKARVVTVYEVEVGRPLDGERIIGYADLWFGLDCEFWTLQLITVDRFGGQQRRPLKRVWYGNLAVAA